MVEEITTAIARLPWLFVIARNSAFTYKGKPVDVKQVAQELSSTKTRHHCENSRGQNHRVVGAPYCRSCPWAAELRASRSAALRSYRAARSRTSCRATGKRHCAANARSFRAMSL